MSRQILKFESEDDAKAQNLNDSPLQYFEDQISFHYTPSLISQKVNIPISEDRITENDNLTPVKNDIKFGIFNEQSVQSCYNALDIDHSVSTIFPEIKDESVEIFPVLLYNNINIPQKESGKVLNVSDKFNVLKNEEIELLTIKTVSAIENIPVKIPNEIVYIPLDIDVIDSENKVIDSVKSEITQLSLFSNIDLNCNTSNEISTKNLVPDEISATNQVFSNKSGNSFSEESTGFIEKSKTSSKSCSLECDTTQISAIKHKKVSKIKQSSICNENSLHDDHRIYNLRRSISRNESQKVTLNKRKLNLEKETDVMKHKKSRPSEIKVTNEITKDKPTTKKNVVTTETLLTKNRESLTNSETKETLFIKRRFSERLLKTNCAKTDSVALKNHDNIITINEKPSQFERGDLLGINDPGSWPANIPEDMKLTLLKNGPVQIEWFTFPKNKKYKCFSSIHYQTKSEDGLRSYRNWLVYSILKDAAFCFPCRIFSYNSQSNLSNLGFRNWKKLPERLDAHEKSVRHLESMDQWTLCCIENETDKKDSVLNVPEAFKLAQRLKHFTATKEKKLYLLANQLATELKSLTGATSKNK